MSELRELCEWLVCTRTERRTKRVWSDKRLTRDERERAMRHATSGMNGRYREAQATTHRTMLRGTTIGNGDPTGQYPSSNTTREGRKYEGNRRIRRTARQGGDTSLLFLLLLLLLFIFLSERRMSWMASYTRMCLTRIIAWWWSGC